MSGAAAEDLYRDGGSGAVVRGGASAGTGAGTAGKGIAGLRLRAAVAHGLLRTAPSTKNRYDGTMLTRRGFAARLGAGAAALRMLPEMAYAQRAAVQTSTMAKDMVWLNANENPAGIPQVALAAMNETLPSAWRYHYQEFRDIYAAIAQSEELAPEQVMVGAGSSEVLHIAVDSLTSPTRPLITVAPTYEGPVELAKALGHPVVLTKLRPDY